MSRRAVTSLADATATLGERFASKWTRNALTGCWEWTAICFKNGYGCIHLGGRDIGRVNAHRASWLLHHGTIPEGLCVCHRCDNRKCVNPEHLFLGTIAENNIDMTVKGRHAAKLTRSQVIAIRSSSSTQEEAAEEYGVSRGLIGHIRRRLVWRHV